MDQIKPLGLVLCLGSSMNHNTLFAVLCYNAQIFLGGRNIVAVLATSYVDSTVRGSNPNGGEIFRTLPDYPCGPPSFLYSWYRIFFLGGNAAKACR